MKIEQILTDIENGTYATKGRDFGRGMAHAASLLRPEIEALATWARRALTLYPGPDWRTNRERGWYTDVGYAFQDVLGKHYYETHKQGSKPEFDPGWHPCSCGWEGYWSQFHPHVADHLRAVVTERVTTVGSTSTAGDEHGSPADTDGPPVPDLRG